MLVAQQCAVLLALSAYMGDPYCLLMSENLIRSSWQEILHDPDNPRPDIKDVEEWISLAKSGNLKLLYGVTVVIQNTLTR